MVRVRRSGRTGCGKLLEPGEPGRTLLGAPGPCGAPGTRTGSGLPRAASWKDEDRAALRPHTANLGSVSVAVREKDGGGLVDGQGDAGRRAAGAAKTDAGAAVAHYAVGRCRG